MRKIIIILLLFTLVSCKTNHDYKIWFLTPPCITPHEKYRYYTCSDMEVLINDSELTIPKHFETDLASIPRFYWAFMTPSNSDFMGPSILHDYLYRCTSIYTRIESDNIFYYALRDRDVSVYTSYKMYIAVRLFGAGNFDPKGLCGD